MDLCWIKIDSIFIILLIFAFLPWGLRFVDSLELNVFGWVLKITPKKEIYKANQKVDVVEINKDAEKEVKYNSELPVTENVNSKIKYLSFKARINYPHEAGAYYLLRVKVNDVVLDKSYIINREHGAKLANGRIRREFDSIDKAWNVVYSPDFASNYLSKYYKVLNFDPYLFVFNISEFIKDKTNINIKFCHVGPPGDEAYKNSIIIRELGLF
jgi:hypothetical protein